LSYTAITVAASGDDLHTWANAKLGAKIEVLSSTKGTSKASGCVAQA